METLRACKATWSALKLALPWVGGGSGDLQRPLLGKIFLMFCVAVLGCTWPCSPLWSFRRWSLSSPWDPERNQKGQQKRLALKNKLLRSDCGFVSLLFLIESLRGVWFCFLVVSQPTHVPSLVRTTQKKLCTELCSKHLTGFIISGFAVGAVSK